jgi:riboflavin kinase/FMN adenylyltransferase
VSVEEELAGVSPQKETLLTIGVFDGVHLGHKYLISRLVEQARRQALLSAVITFKQHPQELLSPQTELPFLTDLTERINLLEKEGVNLVIPLSFTTELAQLDAHNFVSLLQRFLKMRGLVVGPDFALGRNREGDVDTLARMGREMNFSVTVVAPLTLDGEAVSSTAIRKAIIAGDMEKASRLAGRPFSLHGQVVSGAGRGVGLGFPTANLGLNQEQALPADGVYASWAYIDGKIYPAMTNIGDNPTFDGKERTAEVYLIEYHGDLYGRELRIDIVKRLRGEKKFKSTQELKQQIAEDVKQGRAILSSGVAKEHGRQE